jgi:superfamily II DNA or RNA helicase
MITKPQLPQYLRPWQAMCLDQQLQAMRDGAQEFFVAAGVGSGKTVQALSLFIAGDFDFVIVLTPKSGIRASWISDAQQIGVNLHTVRQCDQLMPDDGTQPHGLVLNIHMLETLAPALRALAQSKKVLLVMDEAHHLHKAGEWGNTVERAFAQGDQWLCSFMVGLSGTPYREDDCEILSLGYVKQKNSKVGAPHYVHDYASALAQGEVAPIVTRFVSGTVDRKFDDGRVQAFDFDDGDYSAIAGEADTSLMGERLKIAAVESLDWQMGAVTAARAELMTARQDGHPWAGLICCVTVDQANALADAIEKRWGDPCARIVASAETEQAVAEFRANTRYVWAVSITKISEGVSVNRLRVGVLLSNWTTRSNFEQLRGRLIRLMPGVAHLAQTAQFFVPADPRLIGHAMSGNKVIMHTVPWLKKGDKKAQQQHGQTAAIGARQLDGTEQATQPATQEQLDQLRDALQASATQLTVTAGRYTLQGVAKLDGAAIGDMTYTEEEYQRQRKEAEQFLHPFTLGRLTPVGLGIVMQSKDTEDARALALDGRGKPTGVGDSEFRRAIQSAFSFFHGVAGVQVNRRKHTVKSVTLIALKYNTQKEFRKGDPGAYDWACHSGHREEIFAHFVMLRKNYTIDEVKRVALQYMTRAEFAKNCPNEYLWARRRKGALDEVCKHTGENSKSKHDSERLESALLKCKTFNEFKKLHPLEYKWCTRTGRLDEVKEKFKADDINRVKLTALQCKTRNEFRTKHPKQYKLAVKYDIRDEICSHMPKRAKRAPQRYSAG